MYMMSTQHCYNHIGNVKAASQVRGILSNVAHLILQASDLWVFKLEIVISVSLFTLEVNSLLYGFTQYTLTETFSHHSNYKTKIKTS